MQHLIDFEVDLGTFRRGDLERLDRQWRVVASVNVVLDANNSAGDVCVIEDVSEFRNKRLGLRQLSLGQRRRVVHVQVLVAHRRRRGSAGRSADPARGRRRWLRIFELEDEVARAVESHQVPGRERQVAHGPVGEQLREKPVLAGLGHDAFGAAHIAQRLSPLLVRVEAEHDELGRGLVDELLDGYVEQFPRWVDPHLAPVPVRRFKIRIDRENLVKPRLVEVEHRLQPLDVRVLEEVGVQAHDCGVGVNRAEHRVRLEDTWSLRRVHHVNWELKQLGVRVRRPLDTRKTRPQTKAEVLLGGFGVVVRRKVHEVAAGAVRQEVPVAGRKDARDHELRKRRDDGLMQGDDGANRRDARREGAERGAVFVHRGASVGENGPNAVGQQLLLLVGTILQ